MEEANSTSFAVSGGSIQRRITLRYRTLALYFLVTLVVAATIFMPSPTSSQESSLRSLTLSSWLCPPDIDRDTVNFSTDCQDTPVPQLTIELAEPTGAGNPDPKTTFLTADADGTISSEIEWLSDGYFTLTLDEASLGIIDQTIVDYVVGCSFGDGSDEVLIVEDFGASSVYFEIPQTTSNDVGIFCNWYNLPAGEQSTGRVTIEGQPGTALEATFGPGGVAEAYEIDESGSISIETPSPSTALILNVPRSSISCSGDGSQSMPIDENPPWYRQEPRFVTLDVMGDDDINCVLTPRDA